MKAQDILTEAETVVGGDRAAAYGDPMDGLSRIAIAWNAHLHMTGNPTRTAITPLDVAWMMEGLKRARAFTGPYRADNYIDAIGWAAVAGEVAALGAKR